MRISHTRRLSAISIIYYALSIQAATYYVAVNGNDGDSGTSNAPLKTISAAAVKANAGDSILVKPGTYNLSATINLAKNGTSEHPFYLLAASGERPILDFSAMTVSGDNRGIKLSGSFWHIRGLIIKGAGDNGMIIQGGSNNLIEFCDFSENRDSGCQLMGGAANNRIINCDSYYNRDPGEGNADGFSPKMDVGSGNIFIGCRSWQNSDDGWDGYLRGADNVSTRLENCWCFKNGYRKDGTESSGNGNGFKMGGSDGKDLKHNFTLIRCLSFQNRVKGFDQNNNRGAMTLYNCTAFDNGTNYAIDGGSSTLIAKNCIAAKGSSSLKGGMQSSDNLDAATSNFLSIDPASAQGPRKADGSLPDITFMHLAANSGLIDAGEIIEGITYNGSKPDLGCFETGTPSGTMSPFHSAQSPGFATMRYLNGRFTVAVNAERSEIGNISLFDVSGKKIWDIGPITLNQGINKRDFRVIGLPVNDYICRLTFGNVEYYQSIIKIVKSNSPL